MARPLRRHRLVLVAILAACALSCASPGPPTRRAPLPGAAAPVEWVWSGAVTTTSAEVRTRVPAGLSDLRLLVSTREDLSAPVIVPAAGGVPAHRVATFPVTGLRPDTVYHYAIESAQGRDPLLGRFRTFGEAPFSFSFAFGSCARTGSTSVVFDTMRRRTPLFFLHMGDFHYENIRRNDPLEFRRAFDRVLGSPTQADYYRSTPVVYMWDDHDYGPNDADGTSPTKAAAQQVYRETVPHYPLELGAAPLGRINQAFSVGRVRVIVTDTRSERTPATRPDSPTKSILGPDQQAWLMQELTAAADARTPLVIWANTVPWITKIDAAKGHGWEPYSRERRELADAIKRLGLTSRLVMVSGDAHMSAIDDGTNSNYASDARPGERGFVVVHAAAFDRWPRKKGGPYSHGRSTRWNQFGWADVKDNGRELSVVLSAHLRTGVQIPGLRLELRCETEKGCQPVTP
jgi:phosphodiesterase/alkaline phosphatase D-like protein